MNRKTRRAVLGAAGVSLLAGCSSSDDGGDNDPQNNVGGASTDEEEVNTPTPQPDSDNDGVPDVEDDLPNDPEFSEEVELLNDVRNIPEDEWLAWEYEFDGGTEMQYEFTVREGPAIDVILMTGEEYEHLDDGERYRYIPDGSVMNSTAGGETITPPEDTYRLVVDNSAAGEAEPPTNFDDDIARVEIEGYARR